MSEQLLAFQKEGILAPSSVWKYHVYYTSTSMSITMLNKLLDE